MDRQGERPAPSRDRLTGMGGIAVLVAIGAVGALADGLARGGPGLVLGISLVVGAVVAAMVTSSRVMWLIIPLPPLVFAVMAVASGLIADREATRSLSRLAAAAATWVSHGFVAMMAATLLTIMIVAVRAANRRL